MTKILHCHIYPLSQIVHLTIYYNNFKYDRFYYRKFSHVLFEIFSQLSVSLTLHVREKTQRALDSPERKRKKTRQRARRKR